MPREIASSPLSLSFRDKEAERAFQDDYFRSSLGHGRLCHIMAAVFFVGYGIMEWYFVPRIGGRLLVPRLAVASLWGAGLLTSYWQPSLYRRFWQPLFAFYVLWAGLSHLMMMRAVGPEAMPLIVPGLALTLFFGFAFIRLRFTYATAVGFLVVLAYPLVTLTWPSVNRTGVIADFAYLLGLATLGALIAYRLEYLVRRDFLRTRSLEEANRELEAFAHTVSHDLRAPLRKIDGFSHILIQDHGRELSPEALGTLDRVRAGVARMTALIDGLLAFSRASRVPMKLEDVDPEEVVRECLAELGVAGAGGEVVVLDLPMCRGDPVLLRQVFMNLLDNALKFSAGRESPRVEVGSIRVGGSTGIYVKDRGVGFEAASAGRVFDAFQRLHGDEFPGTGVGLATVQRIVHRHGGVVWAEGEVGAGATVYFTLPP